MGEAGKLREMELLSEIESLKKQLNEKDQYITTLANTIKSLENDVKSKIATIGERDQTIA